MSLVIFRENFVNRLRGSIRANLGRYSEDESWVEEMPAGASAAITTTVEPAEELELLEPDGEDLKDFENSIRVFSAFPTLTPIQARDPRLWTRLTHVECWEYMRKRWNVERAGDDKGKAERFILSRYFIAQNQSRSLMRNGLARLWWYAYLTHAPDRGNPFELTGVLLSTLDITQQILERSLGRVPQVTGGFLEFLLRHKKKLVGPGPDKRARVRHLAKHLNLFGGVTLLDCLSKSDVVEVLEEEFDHIEESPEVVPAV